jgi:S1-C subfamily serine protease
MKSYYQTLGLSSRQAAPEEVEAAYRRLAGEFADNADYQKAIGEAYATLIDPQQRAAYDRRLQMAEAAELRGGSEERSAPAGNWRWLGLLSLAVAAGGYYHASRPKVPSPAMQAPAVADIPQPALPMSTEGASPPEPDAIQPERVVEERLVVQQQPRETQIRFVRPDRKPGFDAAYLAWTTYLVVGGKSRGSGVMIAPDKILTNCHVVAGNAMSGLVVINSATRERAKVDKYSKLEDDEDVCLLNAPGAPAYLAEWGRSEALDPGAATHTVSFPGNEGLTWSSGTLIRREAPLGMEVLVTSNYCRPGVSGGPLFDDKGLLVGITSAGRIFRSGGSECMSLTAETAKKVLYKPMVPIGLAPAQYDPAMLRR